MPQPELPVPIELLDEDRLALASGQPEATVLGVLRVAARIGASDVHLRAERVPLFRVEGELRPLGQVVLSAEIVAQAAVALAEGSGVELERLRAMQLDFSCVISSVGRFRAHMYRQAGTIALVLHRVPDPIPSFAALRLPPVMKRIALAQGGLVLVVGATATGKSTTIAAMLEYVNQTASKHIVTIEAPVEFAFQDHLASFSQREVGRDVESFEQGLSGALREDPDVAFVGELQTRAAFDLALNAAESGRTVVSTCYAKDAARTVFRLVNFYPADQRESIRSRLADSLVAIVGQRLVPRKGARSRVLCTEVLMSSSTIRDCIRDPNRARGLTAALDAGTLELGTHSFDQMLVSMVRDGVVTLEAAQAAATSPSDLSRAVKNLR